MQVKLLSTSGFSFPIIVSLLAYVLGLVALFIPAEIIVANNETFSVSLWFQHTGKMVGAFLLVSGLIQLIWWRQTKQWITWPGWLYASFVLLFVVQRGWHVFDFGSSPMASQKVGAGLFLLLFSALLLIGASIAFSRSSKSTPA